jgi:hypothetical protein
MKVTTALFLLFTGLFLSITSYLGFYIVQHSLEYKKYKENYSEILDYKQRLLNAGEYLMSDRSWQEKKSEASYDLETGYTYLKSANDKSLQLVAIMAIYIASIFFINFREPGISLFILALIVVSLSALAIGLFAPMLEIAAFEKNLTISSSFELPFIGEQTLSKVFPGDMYFYYQSKSIYELILLLLEKKNFVVAFCISIFSVVIPAMKLASTLLVMAKSNLLKYKLLRLIVYNISKWSMADVFVAATFLAYLSFNNLSTGISTESHTLIGLYFFLGYCLLSIITGQLIEARANKLNPAKAQGLPLSLSQKQKEVLDKRR